MVQAPPRRRQAATCDISRRSCLVVFGSRMPSRAGYGRPDSRSVRSAESPAGLLEGNRGTPAPGRPNRSTLGENRRPSRPSPASYASRRGPCVHRGAGSLVARSFHPDPAPDGSADQRVQPFTSPTPGLHPPHCRTRPRGCVVERWQNRRHRVGGGHRRPAHRKVGRGPGVVVCRLSHGNRSTDVGRIPDQKRGDW